MLFSALFTVSLSHFNTSRVLFLQQEELKRLRTECGYLNIADPTKIHILALPTKESHTYRWRVYFPPGTKDWAFRAAASKIPVTGISEHNFGSLGWGTIEGEHKIEATYIKNPAGVWTLRVEASNGAMQMDVPPEEAKWLEPSQSLSSQGESIGAKKTEVFDLDKPILLIRHRILSIDGTQFSPTEGAPGLLLWLLPSDAAK